MAKQLILLLGVIGSGKSYMAETLQQTMRADVIYLADELRRQAWQLLGEEPEDYESFKKSQITKNLTGRQLLQRLADVVKDARPDHYIDATLMRVNESESNLVVIPDVRFIHEVEALCDWGNYPYEIYLCNFESSRYDKTNPHPSEDLSQRLVRHLNPGHLEEPMELSLDIIRKVANEL
jgi:predicted Ser/Thr protein kinase